MNFEKVIVKLEKVLKAPLPGKVGQTSMAPLPVDERRFATDLQGDFRKGAVLMLFYPNGNRCYIPFIKRPDYKGVHSGQVALPGGKWEPSDRDLSQTALREAEEEIGVDSNKIQLLGRLSDLYVPPSNFMVSPYIGLIHEKPVFHPDPKEVERIITCPVDHLINKSIRKVGAVNVRDNYILNAPYFDIGQEMVWGATAMILGEFMYLWENS